jgi:hypothetical protein
MEASVGDLNLSSMLQVLYSTISTSLLDTHLPTHRIRHDLTLEELQEGFGLET